jgi:hypothetical protein
MGKYILYIVIALIVAFTANFFGIVSIPWLDVPFATDSGRSGAEKIDKAADEALKDTGK